MGFTQVTVRLSHPADAQRSWEGLFLVGTGAADCLVPGRVLRELGIAPEARRTFELADGSDIQLDIGGARIEFMGEVVFGTVVFGPDDAEPLLGVTVLESVGIEVDPRNQRLKRLPAPRLKGLQADEN
jgi:clan AA aspartic protease